MQENCFRIVKWRLAQKKPPSGESGQNQQDHDEGQEKAVFFYVNFEFSALVGSSELAPVAVARGAAMEF